MLVILVLPRTEETSHPDVTILYQSEGLLGQLKVADVTYRDEAGRVTGTDRLLFVNRTAQTWIHRDSGEPAWDYVRFLTSLGSLAPAGSRALLLGLGGGIVARELQQVGHIVDSVELDERIARIARDYFGLESNGDVIVDDGRHFLRSTDRRYDLIMFDVFQAEVPPAHMLTLEAFRELRRLLNPGGFVVINYSGFISGSTGRGARSIYRTLREAGFQVQLLSTGAEEATSNNLMIAADHEVDLGAPRAPIIVGRGVRPLADFVRDTGELDFDDALLLVDNRPILERLNLEAAAVWRRGYYEYFTRPFVEKGIPLFD